jgi:hypothetical protein
MMQAVIAIQEVCGWRAGASKLYFWDEILRCRALLLSK